ncbi:hydroxycarboxylic acid receptor 2-like [Hyperolius riggenbachi]|uniref:hydroxycarboxylic acid receptor 2-like n=1 Tax=Hyperolius riggenbachi TaxID=752182 RepID=UPI0035A3A699
MLESYQNQSNSTCCPFEEPVFFYMLPPVLIVTFLLGLILNGFALWAFCFHVKEWKSSTVYLFNLSLADFLLIICLPFRTDYYLKHMRWTYGDAPCRFMLFMLAMNRTGSILFLTLIALDRYIRVVHPYSKINSMSSKLATIVACTVWLATILLAIYIFMKVHTGGANQYCDSFMVCPAGSRKHDLLYVLMFFLPFCVVLLCTGSIIWRLGQRNLDKNAKIKKAVKCITVVAVLFSVCYLPSVWTRIEVLRLQATPEGDKCSTYKTADTAFYIAVCFTYMNSMCNPLVYYFSSPSFRQFYLKIMKCSSVRESESEAGTTNTNNQPQTRTIESQL